MRRLVCLLALAACGHPRAHDGGDDAATGDATTGQTDGAIVAGDAAGHGDGGGPGDGGTQVHDAGTTHDGAAIHDAPAGLLDGGPCAAGTAGATAFRMHWANSGGTAYPVYEVDGLPDKSRDHVGAYGYQVGFTPSYVDPFLAEGGLQLDGSDFVDIELTTAGVAHITSAHLSLYGRSYDTTASGSFDWQTFDGAGATPADFVSNVAPYQWYSADMTTEISPGDSNVLIRIKAGPSSDALVVHRIELCMEAS